MNLILLALAKYDDKHGSNAACKAGVATYAQWALSSLSVQSRRFPAHAKCDSACCKRTFSKHSRSINVHSSVTPTSRGPCHPNNSGCRVSWISVRVRKSSSLQTRRKFYECRAILAAPRSVAAHFAKFAICIAHVAQDLAEVCAFFPCALCR